MDEKWNLAEAQEHYFEENAIVGDDTYELENGDGIGIGQYKLPMTISIAAGSIDGDSGFSVILSPAGQVYDGDHDEPWNFGCLIPYRDDMTKAEQFTYIVKALGIDPNERVWEDGANV